MTNYQEVKGLDGTIASILYKPTHSFIPIDNKNRDYITYLNWVDDGGIPDTDPTYTLQNKKDTSILIVQQSSKHQIEIIGEWVQWRQLNAQDGIYGTISSGTKTVQQHCSDYIRSIIIQSNIITDSINSAITFADIDTIISNVTFDVTNIFSYTEVKNGA